MSIHQNRAHTARAREERLDSWKDIAAYLQRDVSTVQRWEKREGMPVHRHVHDKLGSVYAFRSDLDAWRGRASHVAPTPMPTARGVANNTAARGPAAAALVAVSAIAASVAVMLRRCALAPAHPAAVGLCSSARDISASARLTPTTATRSSCSNGPSPLTPLPHEPTRSWRPRTSRGWPTSRQTKRGSSRKRRSRPPRKR